MKNTFHYVYILVSESDEARYYTGLTKNPESRLKAHKWRASHPYRKIQTLASRDSRCISFHYYPSG
ncbi:hypothetical protein UR09_06435 [Candidatus Nitromaritima sp. SCGC AAA799-A02]|nr:hypothetical protein UR09_06435 [Candidatus Nitromaritima sp. SCGC AAA799-A02]KMP11224.1 hypothetical protein UZ36_05195 [Candidatus Nitromaritima sp. SCGC AAA799-C22]